MDHLDYYRIEKAINYIETNLTAQPTLTDLSKELDLSEFHLQKIFKRWAGISPKKFLEFITLEKTKEILREQRSVTAATYDTGLSSTSRLHDLYVNIEAVTPKEYRTMGKGLHIYYSYFSTKFGRALIAATDRGLTSIYFSEDESALIELRDNWPYAIFIEDNAQITPYFEKIFGESKDKHINLFLKGTNFQIQVWRALLRIPEGQLRTYEDIAKEIDHPQALRAVGSAIGSNHISYLIPCHRVINKIGVIGNYRWGSTRKKAMLASELLA